MFWKFRSTSHMLTTLFCYFMETMVIKRKRDTPESEMRYRQNKRIMNEGLNSLSLSKYTSITDVDGGAEYSADYDVTPPPTSSSRQKSSKTSPRSNRRHGDSDHEVPTIEEEYMLSVIKGGQKKFLRKVDFLVDELIRKSSRSEYPKAYCPKEFDSQLPASLGPSPTADHALSNPFWLVNYLENGGKVQCTSGIDTMVGGTPASPRPQGRKPCIAGDTTHSDWGIIELPKNGNGHSFSPFKSPQTHQQSKLTYYASNSASNSSESVDRLAMTTSSPSVNNGFRNIHSNTYDSDSDAMEEEERPRNLKEVDDELDDEEASTERLQRSSVRHSRQNSIDSTYSDVSALSEISNSANNPYYVDPEDNVYFMLNGDITATPHKRRDNRSFLSGGRGTDRERLIEELRQQQHQQRMQQEQHRDEDQMNDESSAGGYQYHSPSHKNLEKDLGTVGTGDAVFCID